MTENQIPYIKPKPKYVPIEIDALHSVWNIDTVNPFLSNFDFKNNCFKRNHPAPFPERLAFNLIQIFSQKNDWVLDPFSGSGTTPFVALSLFRNAVGYDLEENYIRMAKDRCSGQGTFYCKSSDNMSEIPSNKIKLCITSPPYLHLRHYSDNPQNLCNLENPYNKLIKVFEEVYRVLKPGGYFCLNVSDVPDGNSGNKKTFPYDMIYFCKQIGFKFHESIVWNKGIRLTEFNISQYKIRSNHEYVWVFRK